jgi:hypothetical protein
VEDIVGDSSQLERKAKVTLERSEPSWCPSLDHRAVDSGRKRCARQDEGLHSDTGLLGQQPEQLSGIAAHTTEPGIVPQGTSVEQYPSGHRSKLRNWTSPSLPGWIDQ